MYPDPIPEVEHFSLYYPPNAFKHKKILTDRHVGNTIALRTMPTPQAVIDIHIVRQNCNRMLSFLSSPNVPWTLSWRPHVKTHKCYELTMLSTGCLALDGKAPARTAMNLVASTVSEICSLIPFLAIYKSRTGHPVNVLYGVPPSPTAITRLLAVLERAPKVLGPECLSFLIDDIDQLEYFDIRYQYAPNIMIKIDTGYTRAGLPPTSDSMIDLLSRALMLEKEGKCHIQGLYSHAGHSYSFRTTQSALELLEHEFRSMMLLLSPTSNLTNTITGTALAVELKQRTASGKKPLILSAGASPTTLASTTRSRAVNLPSIWQDMETLNVIPELHAGVYTLMDLQQIAVHNDDGNDQSSSYPPLSSPNTIALTIVADVSAHYKDRDEYLIGAGNLALGREPVVPGALPPSLTAKQADGLQTTKPDPKPNAPEEPPYTAWGVIAPWNSSNPRPKLPPLTQQPTPSFPRHSTGWVMRRISQEHGILGWDGPLPPGGKPEFSYGQKLRIWPNHACIAASMFEYYVVVDGREEDESQRDVVCDIWPRWPRGEEGW